MSGETRKNLGRILEGKKLWLGVYLAIAAISGIVRWTIASFVVFDGMQPDAIVNNIYLALGVVQIVGIYVYYAYRLLYLYRGEPKRVMWSVLTVLGVVLMIMGSFMESPLTPFSAIGAVLSICCWLKDFVKVFWA